MNLQVGMRFFSNVDGKNITAKVTKISEDNYYYSNNSYVNGEHIDWNETHEEAVSELRELVILNRYTIYKAMESAKAKIEVEWE